MTSEIESWCFVSDNRFIDGYWNEHGSAGLTTNAHRMVSLKVEVQEWGCGAGKGKTFEKRGWRK
jgi:hypothetical protein